MLVDSLGQKVDVRLTAGSRSRILRQPDFYSVLTQLKRAIESVNGSYLQN